METPIADFVRRYADSGMRPVRTCPATRESPFWAVRRWTSPRSRGADSLYEADGIIAAQ